MRIKVSGRISLISILLLVSSVCHAYDTDLYVLSGANIPPNVFIILDSSASMDKVSSGQNYDPTIDYSLYAPQTVYPANEVYYKSGKNWVDTTYTTSTLALTCPDLVNTYLLPFGQAINYSSCGYNNKDFQTGNFMNFLQLTGGPGGSRSRFGLATGIIHSYINTTSGVRFAVMAFNRDTDGNTVRYVETVDTSKEYVFDDDRDDSLDAVGGQLLGFSGGRPGFVDEYKIGKTEVFNDLATLKNDSWSPLAETLYEAGVVYQNGTSALTGMSYSDPKLVQYYCQKNYVLIISDGASTKDSDPRLSSAGITDSNGDGKIGLDEVSKYLYDIDLSNGTALHKQNVKTYTVGFSVTQKLMEDTARNGGGKYFYVWSSQSFNIAFQTFIAEVLDDSVSYVAPVVPISQMEKTSAGSQMYLAMFKPTMTSFWRGNIKKYCIAKKDSSGRVVDCSNNPVGDTNIRVGDILDAKGALLLTTGNEIKDTAQSYWSSVVDGGNTDTGGVGEVLQNRTEPRNIYTYFRTNVNLTDSSNAFSTSNSAITPSSLGLASGDTTGRNNIVNFIHGYDVYYQNELPPQGPTAKRNWILGAFIHSRPVVIHYADRSVIYAGANDGMLHAFDDATGEELWGFIPPDLLPNLKNLTGEAVQFYVDGPPKAYIERDGSNNIVSATLIFGERRGGNHYTALDITNPLLPKFLWSISPSAITYQITKTSTTAYQEMGQTWSAPQLGQVEGGKWVAFISGGYDDLNQDLANPGTDTKGRAIYVVDVSNGSLMWSYSYTNNTNLQYCISSDIARVDTNGDGYIDRLYVGDIGGQIWRFDLGGSGLTGKILFDSNWGASVKRKFFYPPDVTLEPGYEMIFIGTGDREHPKDTTKVNRLYAVKDKNPSSPLKESDLADVTLDLLQVGTDSEKTATINELQTKSGWFILLDQNVGEKCLSSPALFFGTVYYTTFTPVFGDPGDPCFLSQGEARLYAVNYKTGSAVFNLDDSGTLTDLTRDDRSVKIGVSIPSGVIITFVGGTTVGYGGVGGGVFRPSLSTSKTVFPISWRIAF